MPLRPLDHPPGPPWRRPLAGRFEELTVASEVLVGNPLGDPVERPLQVYSSPGVVAGADGVTSVYVLQGFGGQLDGWLARKPFEPLFMERLDAMFAAGDCPDAVIVFVDAWTSLGGSQFLNSSATGAYTDYLCDEVVPFIDGRYPTAARRGRRAVTGHSSGGYGALVLPMLRPETFGALVAHAPDALFEACYMGDIFQAARVLRDRYDGSYPALLADARTADRFDWGRWGAALSVLAMAAAYSPDPERPGQILLPFDPRTGRIDADVWERWLARDPVRMVAGHVAELRGLAYIHIEAGRADEYLLDVGATALSAELRRYAVEHSFELFDGGHGGVSFRYAPAIRDLLVRLGELGD
ncbi:MAG TPA: alpha/beta hydrolase-fold protein [Solirubrobacteraceae bacterium]|nr:alpha/beta hydrolase-fold protein [Solirubrobacteraceae bacterium]